jgi:hypothetical protein
VQTGLSLRGYNKPIIHHIKTFSNIKVGVCANMQWIHPIKDIIGKFDSVFLQYKQQQLLKDSVDGMINIV